MAHTCLTTGHTVGFKQTHLGPAQAKTMGNDIVNILGCGNAVFDQPQGFAPDRLKQAITNMRVNLASDHNWLHADLLQHVSCGQHIAVFCPAHQFNHWQQIHRIIRMRDNDLISKGRALTQLGRGKARGGRGNHAAFNCMVLYICKNLMLDVQPFRHRFLNPMRPGHRLFQTVAEHQPAFFWQNNICQQRQAGPGIVQNLTYFAAGIRVRVKYMHRPAIEQEPGRPAAPDHTAPDYCCCFCHISYACCPYPLF